MKNILVTGGSGFIGANFIEAYKDKFNIYAPSSSETDLTKFEEVNRVFRDNKFDAVLHLAGKHDALTGAALEADNLIMFKNVQYAATLYGVKKLIVVGDAADMDLSRPLANVTEKSFGETIPMSGYGLGRYLIHLLAGKDKISTVLRFFGVYGKGAPVKYNRQMEILSHAIVGKKQISISADKTFSTIYIEDACKIIAQFLDKNFERGMYNVASPTPATYFEFARKAKSYAKKNGREITLQLGKELENELTANVDKLIGALGSFKFTSLSTGINKTLDYCKSHKSALKADKEEQGE